MIPSSRAAVNHPGACECFLGHSGEKRFHAFSSLQEIEKPLLLNQTSQEIIGLFKFGKEVRNTDYLKGLQVFFVEETLSSSTTAKVN